MAMRQHTQRISRKRIVDRILHFYDKGVKQFWEVYAGQRNLSKAMMNLGYEVTTFDFTTGWNFEKAHHRREFFRLLRKVCPDFVWSAPPCTVWSPLQNLTYRTEEQLYALQCDRDYQEHIHLKFTARVFQEQSDEDRDAGVEELFPGRHLPSTRCFKVDTLHKSINVPMAVLPDEKGNLLPIRKPTSLCLTSPTL